MFTSPPVPPDVFAAVASSPVGEQLRQLVELLAGMTNSVAKSPFLDVKEAAAYCRVAVQTIYNNRRHIERMPGVRKLLFRKEALDRFLATRRKHRR